MTPDEAIEGLGDEVWDYIPEQDVKARNALKLGIEALKRIKADRFLAFPYVLNPLPGETED